ncbi:MAG: hypothetical protein MHM6MM_007692, partial [Cercozoa sp. M6MM]
MATEIAEVPATTVLDVVTVYLSEHQAEAASCTLTAIDASLPESDSDCSTMLPQIVSFAHTAVFVFSLIDRQTWTTAEHALRNIPQRRGNFVAALIATHADAASSRFRVSISNEVTPLARRLNARLFFVNAQAGTVAKQPLSDSLVGEKPQFDPDFDSIRQFLSSLRDRVLVRQKHEAASFGYDWRAQFRATQRTVERALRDQADALGEIGFQCTHAKKPQSRTSSASSMVSKRSSANNESGLKSRRDSADEAFLQGMSAGKLKRIYVQLCQLGDSEQPLYSRAPIDRSVLERMLLELAKRLRFENLPAAAKHLQERRELHEQRKLIDGEVQSLSKMPLWKLLQRLLCQRSTRSNPTTLSERSSVRELRSAYKEAAKLLHPDRTRHDRTLTATQRHRNTELFKLVSRKFSEWTDRTARPKTNS